MSSSDVELRTAQRNYKIEPGDSGAREHLRNLERRLDMSPSQFEVESFTEHLRDAAVANSLHPLNGDFPFMSRRLLSLVAEHPLRDRLRWAWFRVTVVQSGSPPLALVIRNGDKIMFAIGRAMVGSQNVLAPQLVWPDLGPNWFPGAHEHGAMSRGSTPGHEYRTSWDESDLDHDTGVCRACGDTPKDPRVVNERPVFEKKLAEFSNGVADPYSARSASTRFVMATTAIVRTYLNLPVSIP